MAFRTAPHRRRAHSLAGALLLAGVVAVLPRGRDRTRLLRRGPAPAATHLGAFTPAGRVVMRELARGGRVTRSTRRRRRRGRASGGRAPGAPRRDGRRDGGADPATAAVAPATGTPDAGHGHHGAIARLADAVNGTPPRPPRRRPRARRDRGPGRGRDGLGRPHGPGDRLRLLATVPRAARPWVAVSATHVVQMVNQSTGSRTAAAATRGRSPTGRSSA